MSHRLQFAAVLGSLLLTHHASAIEPTPPATTQPGAQARDLLAYRKQFPSHLTAHGPAPASWANDEPLHVPAGVSEVTYTSGDLRLKAWVNKPTDLKKPHPAIVFCHGGFSFGDDDWAACKPLVDAGFVVMMPRVRGENGNPGEFEFYGHEVDDVNAAGRFIAALPGVDAKRLFVAGHSAGGSLAALAVMTEGTPFVASAPIGAMLDIRNAALWPDQRHKDLLAFDIADKHELEQRSALLFTAGLRAPIHLFLGDADGLPKVDQNFVLLAHHFSRRAGLTIVPGDHGESLASAMPKIVEWFRDGALPPALNFDLPTGWQDKALPSRTPPARSGINPTSGALFILAVQPKDLFKDGCSLADYAADLRETAQHQGGLKARSDTDITTQTIAGRVVMRYDTSGLAPDSVAAHLRRYCIDTPHAFVSLTCWTQADHFDDAVSDFENLATAVLKQQP